jgi:hypothetical protein
MAVQLFRIQSFGNYAEYKYLDKRQKRPQTAEKRPQTKAMSIYLASDKLKYFQKFKNKFR